MSGYVNHYKYLEEHLPSIMESVGVNPDHYNGLISAAGDKCYGYKKKWEDAGIPFQHGTAIYLLTYCNPYESEVRETVNGFVAPGQWVIDNYERFRHNLPSV